MRTKHLERKVMHTYLSSPYCMLGYKMAALINVSASFRKMSVFGNIISKALLLCLRQTDWSQEQVAHNSCGT